MTNQTPHVDYALCQKGTQQSPIGVTVSNGLSQNHIPTFGFADATEGYFYNWGYGEYHIQILKPLTTSGRVSESSQQVLPSRCLTQMAMSPATLP